MSEANASPTGRSHQIMSEANASPTGRSHQIMSEANASPTGRSHQLMIVTKKALPRRTFLRGMGVTLALPLLDAMVPALSAMTPAANPVRRFGAAFGFRLHPDGDEPGAVDT